MNNYLFAFASFIKLKKQIFEQFSILENVMNCDESYYNSLQKLTNKKVCMKRQQFFKPLALFKSFNVEHKKNKVFLF